MSLGEYCGRIHRALATGGSVIQKASPNRPWLLPNHRLLGDYINRQAAKPNPMGFCPHRSSPFSFVFSIRTISHSPKTPQQIPLNPRSRV